MQSLAPPNSVRKRGNRWVLVAQILEGLKWIKSHWLSHPKFFQYFGISIRQLQGQLHKLAPRLKRVVLQTVYWSKKCWCDVIDLPTSLWFIRRPAICLFASTKSDTRAKKQQTLFCYAEICCLCGRMHWLKVCFHFFILKKKANYSPHKFALGF